MAYSRWSNSRWFTIYLASGEKEKSEQIFDICGVAHFTYAQLMENIEGCLQDTVNKCESPPTQEELEELRGYMCEFLKDVEEEFRNEDFLQKPIN